MTLARHLLELRKRLFRAAVAIVGGAIGGWFASDTILQSIRLPISAIARSQHRLAALNFDSITGAFDLKLQIAVTVGIIASSPIWLYQVFAFLVPGLSAKERRYTFGFFFTAVPLFLGGCAAGWYVVPHIIAVLSSFAPQGASTLIQANDYLTFIVKLVIAVGIAFVLPVFLVLLNFIGVLSSRAILKSWRVALIAVLAFSAAVTPSADVISMFLLAVPMIALYLAAAGVAALHDRRVSARAIRAEAALASQDSAASSARLG